MIYLKITLKKRLAVLTTQWVELTPKSRCQLLSVLASSFARLTPETVPLSPPPQPFEKTFRMKLLKRNCPSLTAMPTFYPNFWTILLMKVLKRNGPSPIAAKIYLPWRPQNIVQKSTKTDMCCVCLWAADYSPASSPPCLFLPTKPTRL